MSASLDDELQRHQIFRQAYRRKDFIGNHCHKYLQPTVYESLGYRVVEETSKLTSNEEVINQTKSTAKAFVRRITQIFLLEIPLLLPHCLSANDIAPKIRWHVVG